MSWKYVRKQVKISYQKAMFIAKYLSFLQTLLLVQNGVVIKAQDAHGLFCVICSISSQTIFNGHFLTFKFIAI